jgi:hypothetical protein
MSLQEIGKQMYGKSEEKGEERKEEQGEQKQ